VVSSRAKDEPLLVGKLTSCEVGGVQEGVAAVVVAVVRDGRTSGVAEQLLGGIYSESVGRTRIVCSDSSNLGFAASYCCCTDCPSAYHYCLVAQYRKWRDNRPQMVSIGTFDWVHYSTEQGNKPYSWEDSRSRVCRPL
jgi:hypothetical protein